VGADAHSLDHQYHRTAAHFAWRWGSVHGEVPPAVESGSTDQGVWDWNARAKALWDAIERSIAPEAPPFFSPAKPPK